MRLSAALMRSNQGRNLMSEQARAVISAKFLCAVMPTKRETFDTTGVNITVCPARVARGAYKPKLANRGDAPTLSHASRTTGTIRGTADRRAILTYAYKGA
jgi:hypothetical protein